LLPSHPLAHVFAQRMRDFVAQDGREFVVGKL
jgi:hypothetical protein